MLVCQRVIIDPNLQPDNAVPMGYLTPPCAVKLSFHAAKPGMVLRVLRAWNGLGAGFDGGNSKFSHLTTFLRGTPPEKKERLDTQNDGFW